MRFTLSAPAVVSAMAAVVALPSMARAAEPNAPGGSEAIFLIQIILLVALGRLIGEGLQRLKQPSVMGALIAGLLLGPSVLGALWPGAEAVLFPANVEQRTMLNALAQFGVLMLLLLAGMETDLGLVRQVRRAAFSVSIFGIIIPFVCGFLVGQFLPDNMLPRADERLVTALFIGTALSISSVKIVAMVVREMNFVRRNIGQVILASAVIDDTIAWIIIAVTFGLAASHSIDLRSIGLTLIEVIAFLGLSLTIGRVVVFRIIRWVNDHFVSEVPVVSAVLVIMVGMALLTDWIGVQDVLGAFVAGILIGESPLRSRQIEDQLRGLTTALFMPIFFGLSGLGADLGILRRPELLALTIGLILIASVGKFAGAFIGAGIGGLDRREALALGFGMNARGSTEIIVASIGLSMGVLSRDLFTMILAMAVLTTFAMPPTLRWALNHLPMKDEEKKRLAREAFEATAFVPNLERLLLVSDETQKSAFASRLAGLLASAKGIPVTTLTTPKAAASDAAIAAPHLVAASAKQGQASSAQVTDAAPTRTVDVGSVEVETLNESTVAEEAKKGYDLLVAETDPQAASRGEFGARLEDVVRGFRGSLAIVTPKQLHDRDPLDGKLDILVPVTGTAVARGAAEVAFVLARATKGSVKALYVSKARPSTFGRRYLGLRADEKAVLHDLQEMATHYDVRLSLSIEQRLAPDEAILQRARAGGHTLVVMGVNRRAGKALSFGETARSMLERLDCSLVLVAVEASRNSNF